MNVEALDHVNIITDSLDRTAEFYGTLLGLVRKDAPPPLTPQTATWMFDAGNRAIIHINSVDCHRTYEREVQPGSTRWAPTTRRTWSARSTCARSSRPIPTTCCSS